MKDRAAAQLVMLDADQLAAATSPAVNVVVVAGPATGKTRLLLGRISHLVSLGVLPSENVCITYTNAAADVIKSRLETRSDFPGPRGFVGTIHSYVLSLLRLHGPRLLGLPARLSVLTEAQTEALLKEVQSGFGGKALKVAAGKVQESLRSEAILSGDVGDVVRRINFELHSRMIRDGMLSYDAILHLGLIVIERLRAEGVQVAHTLLVDEYQDASALVHRICMALPTAGKFIVGDVDQSIMSFMGGSPAGLMAIWRSPDKSTTATGEYWAKFTLERNYRSAAIICAHANTLIGHNLNRAKKQSLSYTDIPGRFVVDEVESQDTEERKLLGYIAALPPDKSAAVLCRTNWQCGRYIAALEAARLPVHRRQRLDLPTDWEAVKGFVAFLANPDNDWLAYQFLLSTRSKPEADLIRAQAVQDLTTINRVLGYMADGIQSKDLPYLASRLFSVPSVELLQRIVGQSPKTPLAELGLALGAAELAGLCDGPSAGQDAPEAGISVLTYHGGKGLEFDWVILPGVQKETNGTEEENRRILYVGITRARSAVFVSAARFGLAGPWQRRPGPLEVSPMLEEL